MRPDDFEQLRDDLVTAVTTGAHRVAILGSDDTALKLIIALTSAGLERVIVGVYTNSPPPPMNVPSGPMAALAGVDVDVVVVASDETKEELLRLALPYLRGAPKVIVAGYGHLTYRDSAFHAQLADLLVPSLANGYPHSLVHLYQCLQNAARLGLSGTVAEFGMFKGGTTMFLAKVIKSLGTAWPVIGFDTFDGFPPRRSPLDMYDHAGCVFTDLDAVRRYCDGQGIEIVAGDIVETCHRLDNEDLVLTFIDTDNFSPASAAIAVARKRTVVGGAIVFDHVTGVDRFRYTLGERIAAQALLDDRDWLHLHGTGVFYRQSR